MLREIVIAAILFSQFANAQSPGCQSNCQDLSYYDCYICYDSCPNGTQTGQNATVQYNFTLKQCTQTYCAYWVTHTHYSGNTSYTTTQCGEYDQRNLTQSDCINHCCDKPSYNKFTNETFGQCVDKNNAIREKMNLIGMIVGIIFGSIFAIGLLILLLSCCLPKFKQCLQSCCCTCPRNDFVQNQNRNQNQQMQPQQQSHVVIQKLQESNDTFVVSEKLLWAFIDQKQLAIFQETCSICLNRNINCQTSCGHKFHFDCFKLWTGKNPSCPNCKSEFFNDLKLYCMICWKRQAKYHLKVHVSKEYQNFNIACDQCSAKKLLMKEMVQSNDSMENQT